MKMTKITSKFALISIMSLSLAACVTSPTSPGLDESSAAALRVQQTVKTQAATPKPATRQASNARRELEREVGDRVFFTTDKSTLSKKSRDVLTEQAAWLAQNARIRVTIEGHADERGTRDYNLALGARRATAVRDYLLSLGVDASRIGTISWGKERPVSLCSNESCWSKNRRAVTIIR